MPRNSRVALLLSCFSWSLATAGGVTEFCLDGELDLGARYQGTRPEAGEFYPTTWCVVTEDESQRVLFAGAGKSNPDMDGGWTVAYIPPDLVRIVNRDSPPDIEFLDTDNLNEALRVRRIDPRRLLEESRTTPKGLEDLNVDICGDRLLSVKTSAQVPLRGQVDVTWNWDWANDEQPKLRLMLDDTLLFKATGRWRNVSRDEAQMLWQATPGADPIEVSGDRWPAQINMQVVDLAGRVYMIGGVRTGFQHLVVDTDEGLVVADAPAGWVEFHHLPPSDLVPGYGVSGLSEKLVDFLAEKFPTRPIRAVALTHFHDDHAGGARAFAAAGAEIFAPKESARFFETALNRPAMPDDRLALAEKPVVVSPVTDHVIIGSKPNRVKLMSMGSGPHTYAMLGFAALDKDFFFVSDVHVPRSEADTPRENRAATECHFAQWAVKNLSSQVRIVNSHSAPATPVSRLHKYLESDLCVRNRDRTND
ncbi:MAG: MBL fold metallo-hydrolase [Gammaproteobacteria bacterium]|nr:MBL fold metallo-hydrolase [Gammaproteobacteria bacterium]MDH3767113.1 MBL fold metallo-hydrolase [Gammaproteobacteria bacterium]